MGRYDQNPTKKNTSTTFFIVAMIIALTLGIAGNYYVLKRQSGVDSDANKQEKTTELSVNRTATENPAAAVDNKLSLTAPDQNPSIITDVKALGLPSTLPDLLTSDDIFRHVLTRVSPELASWLTADQLIRKFVILVNDFSQGQRIAEHLSFIRLDRPFTIEQNIDGSVIDSDSYNRYNRLAQAIQLIDAKMAVAVYKVFKPLMLQVFAEFSYPPDITLETIIKKAAAEVIAAPTIEQPILLVRPSVYYKFADPTMEALSPVQKQMLRMGPQNTRLIQSKLREFMVEFAKQEFKS